MSTISLVLGLISNSYEYKPPEKTYNSQPVDVVNYLRIVLTSDYTTASKKLSDRRDETVRYNNHNYR